MNSHESVGTSIGRVDGPAKATGEFVYPSDIKISGMLVGKVLRSPHPHALIKNIEVSTAERMKGVVAVVTASDLNIRKFGQDIPDETVLAVDKVRYIGDEIAVVVALDEKTALEALKAIQIEYELLPAFFEPHEAMNDQVKKEHLIHCDKPQNIASEIHIHRGDIEKGFAEADLVFEATYGTDMVHQAYMEANVAIAHYERTGKLTIWSSTQWPSRTREDVANALGVDPGAVRIIMSQLGGGFGGKFSPRVALLAAVASRKCGRPVRVYNSLSDDFQAAKPYVPCMITIKTGVKRDGAVTARQIYSVCDNGAYSDSGAGVLSVASTRGNNVYRLKNLKVDGYLVYTNKVATGAYRGYGNQSIAFALEQEMDRMAQGIGMDPAGFRLKNCTQAGDLTVDGWDIKSCRLSECIEWATEASDFKNRRPANGPFKYGKGMACATHVSGNVISYKHWDASGALIKVDRDGKVFLFTGESDIGQGAHTVLTQIAADELGVTPDMVEVHCNDTDICPFGVGSSGCHVTTVGGNAVKKAAANAKKKLLEFAAGLLHCASTELETRDNWIIKSDIAQKLLSVRDAAEQYYIVNCIAVYATGVYRSPGSLDPVTKYGSPSPAYSFACHIAEVAVDTETGKVQVLHYWAGHDVGKPLNPTMVEGQIQGGVAQGIGFALTEKMEFLQGRVLNDNFLDYKCIGPADMPVIHTYFANGSDPLGPFGAKSIGEIAFVPVAAAIANAIADATGVRMQRLPITPSRLLKALKEKN